MRIFERWYFRLVSKLEISYRFILYMKTFGDEKWSNPWFRFELFWGWEMKQPLIPSCYPSSHPLVIIIINLNPNGRRQLGIRIKQRLGIGISFLCYFTMGGVRPMGRVGFKIMGSHINAYLGSERNEYTLVISWRILVSFRGFFEDYIFAWWNIWASVNRLLP